MLAERRQRISTSFATQLEHARARSRCQVPGRNGHEDHRKPKTNDKRPCRQHLTFMHHLNPLIRVNHNFPPLGR